MPKHKNVFMTTIALLLLAIVLMPGGCTNGGGIHGNVGTYDIIFESQPSKATQSWVIYGINVDGTGLTHITNTRMRPEWSPDGIKLATVTENAGNFEINVSDTDGSNQIKLLDMNQPPTLSWSVDSKKIALSYMGNIYAMNIDGSSFIQLTDDKYENTKPLWSPTDDKILFRSNREGIRGLYVMNADGSNITGIMSEYPESPSWSPDGTKILFISRRMEGYGIFVMDADGSNQIMLDNCRSSMSPPVWSPDGKKIAYGTEYDINFAICVMDADGSNQTRLTDSQDFAIQPSWSPDGNKIAFVSSRDGNADIYVMNADGSEQTRLTNNKTHDLFPTWSTGKQIKE